MTTAFDIPARVRTDQWAGLPETLVAADFDRALETMRPGIGHYDWMLWLLRRKSHGDQFSWHRYRRLIRLGRPSRPYFIGHSHDGTKFLGDYRDHYTVVQAVLPRQESGFFDRLVALAQASGNGYVDVGANVGLTAATIARKIDPSRQVTAFEPVPATSARGAATFALNSTLNVRLIRAAVGASPGELRIHLPAGGNSGMASAYSTSPASASEGAITVTRHGLDDLRARGDIGTVGMVKIDVEGGELSVLQGAREILRVDRPVLVFEFNAEASKSAGWSMADVSECLASAGKYRLKQIQHDGTIVPLLGGQSLLVNVFAEPC